MVDIPEEYRGEKTVMIYCGPYGTGAPWASLHEGAEVAWHVAAGIEDRGGRALGIFSGVNDRFYTLAQSFSSKIIVEDFPARVELSDLLQQ